MLTHWKDVSPPEAPFYAVIFISRKSGNLEGYAEMDELMMKEATQQEGFLGYSSSSGEGQGIFISYWKDEAAIERWKQHTDHRKAKNMAVKQWYDYYHSMISKVHASHIFERMPGE